MLSGCCDYKTYSMEENAFMYLHKIISYGLHIQ